jgi:serine/threonine protein phosphatase 1
MKTYAFGDIHGCGRQLDELLDIISPARDDQLVFIGDYIDRGPDSKGVIDRILDLPQSKITLMGNHEAAFMDFLETGEFWMYQVFGIEATFESYGVVPQDRPDSEVTRQMNEALPDLHREFFQSLQLWYESDDYIFVHAGLDPLTPELRDRKTLLWIRELFIYSQVDFGKRVIFGHFPFYDGEAFFDEYKIGIDTGCWKSGVLTAIELPSEKIHQTKGKKRRKIGPRR